MRERERNGKQRREKMRKREMKRFDRKTGREEGKGQKERR